MYLVPSCVFLPGLSDVCVSFDFGKARHLASVNELLFFSRVRDDFQGGTWRGEVSNHECFRGIRQVPPACVPKSRAVVPAEA